jgi:hypothetical protein
MNKKTVWVVTGHSESGDDFGPLTFHNKPNPSRLKEIAYGWDGTDEEDGPGDYGSYVYLTVTQTAVE